ncbi:D-alanine--D-alanine ligase [Candidatus Berkelbacteria bacterium]|nr:D-alanine--D-alanine ligase [Candidatus Berkelbacteria bacterium]
MKTIRVAVLMGGPSGERQVSLASGRGVVKALEASKKFDVLPIEVSKDGTWQKKLSGCVDVAFIAMHGKGGEDGTMQGALELLNIPYTGSGVLASALGMDKVRSLALFRDAGLNVPEYKVVRSIKKLTPKLTEKLQFHPIVTKPNYHGSSLGVSICRTAQELKKGIALAQKYDKDVIVQQFIDGVELTCAVLGNEKPKALPVVEIIANKGSFYDYASKYEQEGSDHIIPARIRKAVEKQVKAWAVKAHQVIGCRGFSRTDFIWDQKAKKLYVLEINTIPGLTPTSLFPDAAKAAGINFGSLMDRLIQLALK